jgi:hypothetical protein
MPGDFPPGIEILLVLYWDLVVNCPMELLASVPVPSP